MDMNKTAISLQKIINKHLMEEKKYHILVVDDEQDLCEILKFNLKQKVTQWTRQTLQRRR